MKKIKHSKVKNTGVLFELLVRQITLEVLNGDKTENAKNIVKEFFAPNTELNKELRLYDILLKEKSILLSQRQYYEYLLPYKGCL